MRNRLEKYNQGDGMKKVKEIKNLEDLKVVTDSADGFMIGISILSKGEIQHSLLTKDFPLADLLKSWGKVKGLVIQNLEGNAQFDF